MTKLEELKRALEAATPGPWRQNPFTPINVQLKSGLTICSMAAATAKTEYGFKAELVANARLIVEAVNNLPKLLEVAQAAEKALAYPAEDEMRMRAQHPLRKALEELNDE